MLNRWRIVAVNTCRRHQPVIRGRWVGRQVEVWFLAPGHDRVGELPSQFCLSQQIFTWDLVTPQVST